MATSVTGAINLQSAYKEEEAALLIYVHAMNAALEDTMKEKQQCMEHLEDTREDWARKLQARHKEVISSICLTSPRVVLHCRIQA